jgi:uncharacterized membrane protein
MRCPGCGREARGDAKFCEYCGTGLAAPIAEISPIEMPRHARPMPGGVWLVIIGIVVMVAGGVIYAFALTQMVDSTSDWWSDPSNPNEDPFNGAMDAMMVSYIVMCLGTVLLFIGLILLVIHE